MNARIAALNVYPVKSCRGIALEAAELSDTGLRGDRSWLIVDMSGRFLTQREEPRLARIETSLTAQSLLLRAPGADTLTVPLELQGRAVEVVCWRDRCSGYDAGDEAARWLSELIGTELRLVRFDPRQRRLSDPRWTGDIAAPNQFTDGFPVLLLSRGSLDDLNSRLATALPMNRFRPNLVLDGVEPYAEDRIDELIIGEIVLRIVKPCTRCAITTTDQTTGERSSDEPLRTLKSYRFSRELKGVMFGQNAIIVRGAGATLAVGQPADVRWREAI